MHKPATLIISVLALALAATTATAQCLIPEARIVSGGPGRDGIPALTNPEVAPAAAADFLIDDDMVLGVVVNGEARAYPHAVFWWHEVINDVVGGRPIVASFCPLTGSGIVQDPVVNEEVLNFGVSGLLFENNLIMFDRATDSLWSQMTLKGVCGPFSDVALPLLPVVQSTWGAWKAMHPETTVVTFNTGFSRNYDVYPYGAYDRLGNTQLLFPQEFVDDRIPMKEVVLGISHEGVDRAYSMNVLLQVGDRAVVNDNVNGLEVAIVFDARGFMAVPFSRRLVDPAAAGAEGADSGMLLTFEAVNTEAFPFQLRDQETGTLWSITGQALEGELAGAQLQPIATYSAFWFAWASFNRGTEIFIPDVLLDEGGS